MAGPGFSAAVERLVAALGRLPGIGAKSAERLAHHLLRRPDPEALELAEAIREAKQRIRHCQVCFHLTEADEPVCAICRDPKRDQTTVCVVEQSRDLMALEKAGELPRSLPRPPWPPRPTLRTGSRAVDNRRLVHAHSSKETYARLSSPQTQTSKATVLHFSSRPGSATPRFASRDWPVVSRLAARLSSPIVTCSPTHFQAGSRFSEFRTTSTCLVPNCGIIVAA